MPLLHVGSETLELALHLLELPPLLLDDAAKLPVLLHHLRARRAPGERQEKEQLRTSPAARHWPTMTECTRRLRAQQVSSSS
jgi:hypothetical protein